MAPTGVLVKDHCPFAFQVHSKSSNREVASEQQGQTPFLWRTAGNGEAVRSLA